MRSSRRRGPRHRGRLRLSRPGGGHPGDHRCYRRRRQQRRRERVGKRRAEPRNGRERQRGLVGERQSQRHGVLRNRRRHGERPFRRGVDRGGSTGTGAGSSTGGSSTGGASAGSTGYVLGGCTPILGCDGSQVGVVAGDGSYGLQDGTPGEFRHPQGLAVDAQGNVYVGDSENNAVRKVDPSGNVTTLAGNGDAGFLDGPAATALLAFPVGVKVSAGGEVYIADQGNQRIRLLSGGSVQTLAGNGQAGFADGTGGPNGTAEFDSPTGVALDGLGDCYVADTGNRAIRLVDPGGNVSTFATLPGLGPNGVAVDPGGGVYATDGTQVFSIGAAGAVSVLAGSGGQGFQDGPAVSSLWSESLFGLAADSAGYVYVADVGSGRLRRIDPSGYVVVVAGGGDGGIVGSGGIDGSSSVLGVDVALDASGNLFTVDEGADQVVKIQLGCAPSGIPQVCCGCNCTVLATLQRRPSAVAADARNVYWTDYGSTANDFQDGAVYQMPVGGGPILALATGQTAAGALAVDQANVYWVTGFSGCPLPDAGQPCPANSGTVNQIPIGGGGPALLLAAGQAYPTAIAVSNGLVYWSIEGPNAGLNGPGSVNAVPIGGSGGVQTLVPSINNCFGMTVDSQSVYWTSNGDGTVMSMPLAGGTPATLASGQDNIYQVLVDPSDAYWWAYSFGDGGAPTHDLMAVPLDGSAAPGPLATGVLADQMVQDAIRLYWTDYDDGLIQLMPKDASAGPTTVCGGQILPEGIAIGGSALFWTNVGNPGDQGGMILTAPLP
ncbi:MAG: NHL repeat-containing protein [Myxococcales bacterium]